MSDSENKEKTIPIKLITPRHEIKEKIGYGGIDPTVLKTAQKLIEDNTQDFRPIANMHLGLISEVIQQIRSGNKSGEEAIDGLSFPFMQLKGQGTMFKYPLITNVANLLLDFLDKIKELNEDAIEVAVAHQMTITAILGGEIKGDGGTQGQALIKALCDAIKRYYDAYGTK